MRRIGHLLMSTVLVTGCAGLATNNPSLGVLLERNGQVEPRLSAYEQGKRQLQFGNAGLAVDAFQAALKETPDSLLALNGLAIAYDRLGRPDVAQRFLDHALTVDPNSAITLNNLAYLNIVQGNTAVALAYAERAKIAAALPDDMMLPEAVSNTVSRNVDIAIQLAASEAQERPSAQIQGLPPESDVKRLGLNEWEVRIRPPAPAVSINLAVAEQAPTPLPISTETRVPVVATSDIPEALIADLMVEPQEPAVPVVPAIVASVETVAVPNLAVVQAPALLDVAAIVPVVAEPAVENSPAVETEPVVPAAPIQLAAAEPAPDVPVSVMTLLFVPLVPPSSKPVAAMELPQTGEIEMLLPEPVSVPPDEVPQEAIELAFAELPDAPSDSATPPSVPEPAPMPTTPALPAATPTVVAIGEPRSILPAALALPEPPPVVPPPPDAVVVAQPERIAAVYLPAPANPEPAAPPEPPFQRIVASLPAPPNPPMPAPAAPVATLVPPPRPDPAKLPVSRVVASLPAPPFSQPMTASLSPRSITPPPQSPASPRGAWRASVPSSTVVRVSNGTGRRLMASRFARYFGEHGLDVRRIANANSFDYRRTVIFYNPEQRAHAEALAAVLPFPVRLAEASQGRGQIELVLGFDLLGVDDTLRSA